MPINKVLERDAIMFDVRQGKVTRITLRDEPIAKELECLIVDILTTMAEIEIQRKRWMWLGFLGLGLAITAFIIRS